MRLWSLHPDYLDRKGFLAFWREALLAQQVLHGLTEKYKNHSHMQRFHSLPWCDALHYMSKYLFYIWQDGIRRGYNMNMSLIKDPKEADPSAGSIPSKLFTVTSGQLALEFQILKVKLSRRDLIHLQKLQANPSHSMWIPKPNPVFTLIHGKREEWEKYGRNS